jgi:hypothetical protein
MGEDRSWMYNNWDKDEDHSDEWMTKKTTFWTVLFHCQVWCGAHVVDDRI